jgi:hypothetical protein
MTYGISKYDCPTEVTLAPIWPYVVGVTCHLFGLLQCPNPLKIIGADDENYRRTVG